MSYTYISMSNPYHKRTNEEVHSKGLHEWAVPGRPPAREFRFDCDTVAIRRVGRHVILRPKHESWEDYWEHATRPSADFVEAVLSRSGDELPLEERATIDP